MSATVQHECGQEATNSINTIKSIIDTDENDYNRVHSNWQQLRDQMLQRKAAEVANIVPASRQVPAEMQQPVVQDSEPDIKHDAAPPQSEIAAAPGPGGDGPGGDIPAPAPDASDSSSSSSSSSSSDSDSESEHEPQAVGDEPGGDEPGGDEPGDDGPGDDGPGGNDEPGGE
jgi:hypothetical protein